MMNMTYKVADTGSRMSDIRLSDRPTGRGYAVTLKQSLSQLQVKNPAIAFTKDAQAGVFDDLCEKDYLRLLHTVEHICGLWKNPDDPRFDEPGSAKPEMNVLMLLHHAIQEILVLETMLWNSGCYQKEEEK